jgi:23S rRNA (uridine2552-2'-O)-methyltransferase
MAKRDAESRPLAVRVKTAKGRRASSTRWLQRQLNDPYVARARREGYRSRSAFKLIEIDDRYRLLSPGQRVLDLGAAPGGWSQVAAARTKATPGHPTVVAVDLLPIDPIPGVVAIEADFLAADAERLIAEAMKGRRPDIILSDMAAPTTGHQKTDALRTANLYEAAAAFATEHLAPDGAFLAKVFRGGMEAEMLAGLKRAFRQVAHVKPKASRPDSVELYLLARGFRGS